MGFDILNKKKSTNVEFLYTEKDFAKIGIKQEFRLNFDFKRKDVISGDNQKRTYIKGYASTNDQDRTDDIITLEALRKSENDLLQPGSKTVFYNHDRNMPIGKTVSTHVDNKGLFIKVLLSMANDVKDIITKIKEGILNSFSIGGRFKKVQIERDKKGNIVAFKILELELFEVSVVGIPANPKASITEVVEKSFGKLLKQIGKGKNKMSKENKEINKGTQTVVTAGVETSKVEKALTEKEVSTMIETAIAPVIKSVGELVKTLTTKVENKAETSTSVIVASKVEEIIPAWAKTMQEQLMKLSEVKVPSRKGVVATDEEEVETIKDPEKVLTELNDGKCIKFLNFIMNVKPSEFKKLSKEEQEIASALWLKAMDNKIRNEK